MDKDPDTTAAPAGSSIAERVTPLLRNGHYLVLTIAFGGCGITMAFVDGHMVSNMHMAGVHSTAVSASVFLPGLLESRTSLTPAVVDPIAAATTPERGESSAATAIARM